jgi:hypothetical protein
VDFEDSGIFFIQSKAFELPELALCSVHEPKAERKKEQQDSDLSGSRKQEQANAKRTQNIQKK